MTTAIVTGTDGQPPIYYPTAPWRQWALMDIYLGQAGANKYVPNVQDYVVDTVARETYYVSYLDATTLVPTLTPLPPSIPDTQFSDTDILIGVGPGAPSETYRIYTNQAVLPATLAVEQRLQIFSSSAAYCQIFKGSVIDGTGQVISAVIDSSGNLVSQAIPLTLCAVPSGTNYTIKAVPDCFTTEPLLDGEVLTAVIYSATMVVLSKHQLLVENTAYIRSTNASMKYITSIALLSPFMSEADPTQIQYPLNVPLSTLNLLGVVNYSDGTSLQMPIDGTKFQLSGLTGYLPTQVSQQQPLVLQYNLSPNELALCQTNGTLRFLTASYTAITIATNGSYSVKLYAFPVWVSATEGYTLEWFLYNLDRNIAQRVTPYVTILTNFKAFNPTQYGVNQQLTVQINLNAVNGSYESFIHAQVVNILLIQAGNNKGTNNWTVGFTTSQTPQFGGGNVAVMTITNQNYGSMSVASGYTTQAAWLNAFYYMTLPIYNTATETGPMVPTHFALYSGDTLLIHTEIANWQQTFTIYSIPADLSNIDVYFTYETDTEVLELSVASVQVQESTNPSSS
jgi:hypothetical protein